jgi:transposase
LYGSKTSEWWQEKLLFSDEAMFELQPRQPYYIHRPVSSRFHPRYVYPRFHHPVKVMVWGCFSSRGVCALEILRPGETVNSQRYVQILSEHLQISMAWSEATIFMHDNAPPHASKVTRQWLADNNITVLDRPGNSPDLNPIENLWSRLKSIVRLKSAKTVEELRKVIMEAWQTISCDYCKKLISSMPARLRQVRQRKGASSSY